MQYTTRNLGDFIKSIVRAGIATLIGGVLATAAGCTNLQSIDYIDDRERVLAQIDPGDIVYVTTKHGAKTQLTVAHIDAEVISGERDIRLDDVRRIEVRKFDAAATKDVGKVALGTVALMAFIAAVVVEILWYAAL